LATIISLLGWAGAREMGSGDPAIFSGVDAAWLKLLAYPDPDRRWSS